MIFIRSIPEKRFSSISFPLSPSAQKGDGGWLEIFETIDALSSRSRLLFADRGQGAREIRCYRSKFFSFIDPVSLDSTKNFGN